MIEIKQGNLDQPLPFLLVSAADGKTPILGATPTVTLNKNGAGFGAAAGAVTEGAHGQYQVAPNAADADTLGWLWLHAEAAGAEDQDMIFQVREFDPIRTIHDIELKTNLIGSVGALVISTISDAGVMTIYRGFSYLLSRGTEQDIQFADIDLAGQTVALVDPCLSSPYPGSVINPGAEDQAVRFEFENEVTAQMVVGKRVCIVSATKDGEPIAAFELTLNVPAL